MQEKVFGCLQRVAVLVRLTGSRSQVAEDTVTQGWKMLKTAHLAEPDNEEVIHKMARWGIRAQLT
jgi:hypothetical protein